MSEDSFSSSSHHPSASDNEYFDCPTQLGAPTKDREVFMDAGAAAGDGGTGGVGNGGHAGNEAQGKGSSRAEDADVASGLRVEAQGAAGSRPSPQNANLAN